MYIFSYFLEVLCLSVSLGKRPYWCIYESKALLLVGAKSSWLVIHLNDACFPLHLLLNTYWKKRKRKRKDIDVCTVCVSSLHTLLSILVFLCSRYFVIPLWRGSGYTTMFAQGLVFNYWLYIIHAVFIKLCICAEQISFRIVGGVI